MRALYSLNIFFYGIGIRIATLFNAKARLWVSGRKNLFSDLEQKIKSNSKPIVWFHCASLGEFEQGRPVMEAFRKNNPAYRILLTFFSPSGYEVRKNYSGADIICYLPLDTKAQARRFVGIANPSLVYFVKYEFWLNFLAEFRKRKIPHFLISSIFREDQIFFKSYGTIFRAALKGFTFIFTQEKESIELLKSIGVNNCQECGDTRFDRVAEIAANSKEIPIAKSFAGEMRKVIIVGSSWPADEEKIFSVIEPFIKGGWKLLLAPHELGESHLESIENGLQNAGISPKEIIRFSNANETTSANAKVLIIDNIGMLSSLYAYGRITYIGGGFGKSIHNVLEPSVFGMPIAFGPRFEKFNEAKKLIEIGAAFCVNDEMEIKNVLEKLTKDTELLEFLSIKSREFVQHNKGATKQILDKTATFLSR